GSVRVAVAGVESHAVTCDAATGLVTFSTPPVHGAAITAGFAFDCAARFDSDALAINLANFAAGLETGARRWCSAGLHRS
ncbi:MAG TPA: DUF2460 domain-containing protein, partial [Rhizomicrobium sp.]|nr:DUF2460 domain-containing protein [Rhizomicrobium sp.]